MDYIKEKLLNKMPPLAETVDKKIISEGESYFNKKYQKQCLKMGIKFNNRNLDNKKKEKVKWVFDSIDMTATDTNSSSRNSKVDLRKLKSDINNVQDNKFQLLQIPIIEKQ